MRVTDDPLLQHLYIVDATVEVLAGSAGGGRALELGIGIGRIALPLGRPGVAVHGIDLWRGGEAISVTTGDFATAKSGGAKRALHGSVQNGARHPASAKACAGASGSRANNGPPQI